jgi:hypothetical protein
LPPSTLAANRPDRRPEPAVFHAPSVARMTLPSLIWVGLALSLARLSPADSYGRSRTPSNPNPADLRSSRSPRASPAAISRSTDLNGSGDEIPAKHGHVGAAELGDGRIRGPRASPAPRASRGGGGAWAHGVVPARNRTPVRVGTLWTTRPLPVEKAQRSRGQPRPQRGQPASERGRARNRPNHHI